MAYEQIVTPWRSDLEAGEPFFDLRNRQMDEIVIDFGTNRLPQRGRIGLTKRPKSARWRNHDHVMRPAGFHQRVEMLQNLRQEGNLFPVMKIGRFNRAPYACCDFFDASRPVGSKFVGRSFLLLVNLARSKFREHFVAFVLNQKRLSPIANDDEIAIAYLHVCHARKKPAFAVTLRRTRR